MYQEVATKLFVPANATVVLPGFPLDGANTVQVEYEVVFLSSNVRLAVEEGNDLQNWAQVAADTARSAVGSYQFVASGIASRYARVTLTGSAGGSGSVVVACVNTQRL
jgi:hypothetical protein